MSNEAERLVGDDTGSHRQPAKLMDFAGGVAQNDVPAASSAERFGEESWVWP
jgi:hypothetical protein